jgi:hypothetical protein
MTETDYTPGDPPVPNGTIVNYFGRLRHGVYEIIAYTEARNFPERCPDGVAYDLWPVGVPRKFGNRGRAVYNVRRTSFAIVREEDA